MTLQGYQKLSRMVIANSIGSLVLPIVVGAFQPDPRVIWDVFRYSAVYAWVIGSMAYTVVPYSWPFSLRLSAPWNWLFRVGVLLLVSVAGTLLSGVIFLAFGWATRAAFWTKYFMDLRVATLVTIGVGIAISFYESMSARLEQTTLKLRTKELEQERVLKLATEARLASLESRIHPHFLFNTLNSISALIREDPKRAERLIERMAALLRFSLDAEHTGLVPLDHEMKIVTDYLEIERARFGNRLTYDLAVGPSTLARLVPPLSVQTLVENSVKYAIGPSRAGGHIQVSANDTTDQLVIAVSDDGPGFDLEHAPAGHGIDNLKGRLSALFGSRAQLEVSRGAQRSTVSLLIPRNGKAG